MAEVNMSVGKAEVFNEQTAPKFEVTDGNGLVGRLFVSRGGVRWLPTGHEEDAHFLNWSDFDRFMRDHPRK